MGVCSPADLAFVEELRRRGVLEELNPGLIPDEDGTVVISCGDGDQTPDLLSTHWNVCSGRMCHHSLMLNGGPLLIPEDSPVQRFGESRVLLEHSQGGRKLKAIKTIVLYGHWPCGAALDNGLTFEQAIRFCVAAKDTVRAFYKDHGEDPEVLLFFHIDLGDKKRTYRFNRSVWETWSSCQSATAAA